MGCGRSRCQFLGQRMACPCKPGTQAWRGQIRQAMRALVRCKRAYRTRTQINEPEGTRQPGRCPNATNHTVAGRNFGGYSGAVDCSSSCVCGVRAVARVCVCPGILGDAHDQCSSFRAYRCKQRSCWIRCGLISQSLPTHWLPRCVAKCDGRDGDCCGVVRVRMRRFTVYVLPHARDHCCRHILDAAETLVSASSLLCVAWMRNYCCPSLHGSVRAVKQLCERRGRGVLVQPDLKRATHVMFA